YRRVVTRCQEGRDPEGAQKPSSLPSPEKRASNALAIGFLGPSVVDFCQKNWCAPANSSSTSGVLPHRYGQNTSVRLTPTDSRESKPITRCCSILVAPPLGF